MDISCVFAQFLPLIYASHRQLQWDFSNNVDLHVSHRLALRGNDEF